MESVYHQRADFQDIAAIFGFNPLRIERAYKHVQPSPVIVQQFRTQIANDAMWIEQVFIRIYERLHLMKQWERSGVVDTDELDQSKEWFDLRMRAIPLLLWRYGQLEDTFTDGAGI